MGFAAVDAAHARAVEGVGGADQAWVQLDERGGQVPAKAVAGHRERADDLAACVQAVHPLFHVADLAERPAEFLDL